MSITWNDQGITREVFLTKRYAFKIPKLIYSWHKFLNGLLANMQECQFWETKWPELCPIVFHIRGGWLVVMPRVEPLSDAEWKAFNASAFKYGDQDPNWDRGYTIPTESKRDSFGKLDGKIVCVDYGS